MIKQNTIPALIGLLFFAGTSFAGPIIVGHSGNFGTIETYDFATGGPPTASFMTTGDHRGRGVQVIGDTVYYAAIGGDIHLAPYNHGLGGPDLGTIPNPRRPGCPGDIHDSGCGVQDLAYRNGVLYALTGYYAGLPIVYGLHPTTGQVISRVPILRVPNSTQSDGFTVLPNGNFLINDGDAGFPTGNYREYNSTTGFLQPGGLVINPGGVGALNTNTGVDYNPGDNSLYFYGLFCFSCHGSATTELVRTDLNGSLLGHVQIGAGGIEDISVLFCQVPRTIGFWKTHPAAWPVNSFTLGSVTYNQTQLLSILGLPSHGDASVILAKQLIAAKLNIANGSNPLPLGTTSQDADNLLSPGGTIPQNINTSSSTGQAMVANATVLDQYNNGNLTPACTP